MHFTDAYHSIPKHYRNRVQAQGGAEPGDVAGILGLPGRTDKVGNRMTGMIIQGINKVRKSKDLYPLRSAKRREVADFTDERLMVLLISAGVLTLFAILLGIHGFLTGRPGWAIANLALLIPAPEGFLKASGLCSCASSNRGHAQDLSGAPLLNAKASRLIRVIRCQGAARRDDRRRGDGVQLAAA